METYFAPPKRTERRVFRNQIDHISHSPIMNNLLKAMSGLLVVLNEDRQLVAMNHAFLEAIGITNVEEVLGLRLGECLSCIHAHEEPNGCGTTPYCVTCGAAIAMMAAIKDDKPNEQICALTSEKEGKSNDMCLLVQAQPVKIDEQRWILIFAQDITMQQFWINLERVFFHDVNNILAALKGMAQLHLMRMPDDQDAQKIKDVAERFCDEMSLQRSLAQHKEAKYMLKRCESSICDIRRQLDFFVKNHALLKNRTLQESWPDENFIVHTDRLLVSRILGNMLVNALEATEEGGAVHLSTTIEGNYIIWQVWNSGFIDEDIQKRIFQRHFSTKADFGRGLGTYSMKLFGEKYLNGKVTFQSVKESGTIFTFSMPL